MNIYGIDFGAKNKSSTVISRIDSQLILLSRNQGDADSFVVEYFKEIKAGIVFIDAPLSLPTVYRTGFGDEYFFRACDLELNAMSPMFLGGLTARAIRIKNTLEAQGLSVFETYPSALARLLGINRKSKRDIENGVGLELPTIKDQHDLDSILCLLSAKRFIEGSAVQVGEATEGVITI